MKICSKCKEAKPLDAFGKYARARDGLFPQCKECKRGYDHKYYRTKEGRKEAIAASNESRRQERVALVFAYLRKHPCVDCGNDDVRVLEFDHVRGVKLGNISSMVHNLISPIEQIIAEIAKCDVRCANCHRIVTCERRSAPAPVG